MIVLRGYILKISKNGQCLFKGIYTTLDQALEAGTRRITNIGPCSYSIRQF